MPNRFNIVLNIEKSLQQDEHQTWGFVIYCCTYTSDADWANVVQSKSTAGAQHAQPCVLYMQDLQRIAGATNFEISSRKPWILQ